MGRTRTESQTTNTLATVMSWTSCQSNSLAANYAPKRIVNRGFKLIVSKQGSYAFIVVVWSAEELPYALDTQTFSIQSPPRVIRASKWTRLNNQVTRAFDEMISTQISPVGATFGCAQEIRGKGRGPQAAGTHTGLFM